jgi:imidazole glycerol-phosphate synthase subunit HisH
MTLLHICDYGSGNIHNVERALVRAGARVKRCDTGDELMGAQAVVIPGVGAFGDCINALRAKGFEDPIKELAASGAWVLGICVGMQVMASYSDEFGHHEGLGIVPGVVRLIPDQTPQGQKLKRPHMGWSNLYGDPAKWAQGPLTGVNQTSPVSFLHSYHLVPDDPEHLLAHAVYGGHDIVAAVQAKRAFGLQFHPEKSGYTGLQVLKNFVGMVQAESVLTAA